MARKRARKREALSEALRESLARQKAIFASPLFGIITLNESGSIESINPAAERMFGYPAEAVVRRDLGCLLDLGGSSDISAAARLRRLLSEDGEPRESIGRRRDGSTFPVDFTLAEMPLGMRRLFVVFTRDVTKRRDHERLRHEFVATVSHEMRTPLTSIAGSLGLLIGGVAGELPATTARLLRIAYSNSQRLVRLINDILDIEKMESGSVAFDFQPVDLSALLEQALDANRGFADEFGIRMRLDPLPGAVVVKADGDRIMQVVTNLLSNAIKFSPAGGDVTVGAEDRGDRIRVCVRDHGLGIPDAFKPRIFGKFAQAGPAAEQPRKGGTGLGLHIAKQIVDRHDGAVGFEPATGGGTIFYFELPRMPDIAMPDAPVLRAPPDSGPAGRPCILHVDDDHDVLNVVAQALHADADVISASSIEDARRALTAGGVDLAVLDLALADGCGLDLLESLRDRQGRAIPAVVFSAQDARTEIVGNVDAVLTKSRASLDRLLVVLHGLAARMRAADGSCGSRASAPPARKEVA